MVSMLTSAGLLSFPQAFPGISISLGGCSWHGHAAGSVFVKLFASLSIREKIEVKERKESRAHHLL